MDSRAEELCHTSARLFTAKQPWHQLCQDIAENFYPVRADFTENTLLGHDFALDVADSYTVNARETLGNGIESMLRQGDWFKLGTGDAEIDEAPANAAALEKGTKHLRRLIRDPRARFSLATKEADMDWVAFGNPVLSVEVSALREHLVFKAHHPRDCAWLKDEDGTVVGLYRKLTLTARDIKKRISTGRWKPAEGLPAEVEQACRLEPERKFNLVHILVETDSVYGDDRARRQKIRHPFLSMYVATDMKALLNEAGAPTFNYVVPQFRTISNLPWGFSPASLNSLPDSRMLQSMARVILEQGEKAVDPPMVGDGQVFSRDLNLFAGGFTQVDLGERDLREVMTTIETGGDGFRIGAELKQDVRALVADAWLLNKLFLPNVREMRELEVMVRMDEFRRAALPFFSPIESEYHSPLLAAAFRVAVTQNMWPPGMFTPALGDRLLQFTFESPLAEAEGQKTRAAFRAMLEDASAGAEIDQTVASIFNWRKATEDAVRGGGAKAEWLVPEEDRQAREEEGAQLDALRRAAAVAREGAGVVSDVSNAAIAGQNAGLLPVP